MRSQELGDASFHGRHAYEKAIALDPREALFHRNLGRALEKQSKFAEAEAASRWLLRGDPASLLERIDEEARLFGEALATPALRARLEASFSRDGGREVRG